MLAGCDAQILAGPGAAAQQLVQLLLGFWVLTGKQRRWYLNPGHQPKPLITLALSYAPSLLLSLLNPWQREAAWQMLSSYNTVRIFGFTLLCCLRYSGQLRTLCLAEEARFRLCLLARYML